MNDDVAREFLARSRTFLTEEFLPRIRACVADLSEDDLWWRPNEASNSVGNLVLHLSGNVRQWIVSGVGGAPDERARQEEFDHRTPISKDALMERLDDVLLEADSVLGGLSPAVLLEERTLQGRRVNVFEAIYHVVEHFSMHTGQIIYVTKLRLGRDLQFYRVIDEIPHPQWVRSAKD